MVITKQQKFRQVVLMIVGAYKQSNDVVCLHDLFSILTPYTHKVIDSIILKYDKYVGFGIFDDLVNQSYIELDQAVQLYDYTLNDNFIKYYGMRLSYTLGNFIKKELTHSFHTVRSLENKHRAYDVSYLNGSAGLLPEELDNFESSVVGVIDSFSNTLAKNKSYFDYRNPFLNQLDFFSTGCFSLVNSNQKVIFFFRNLVGADVRQSDVATFLGRSQATISYIETDIVKRFIGE